MANDIMPVLPKQLAIGTPAGLQSWVDAYAANQKAFTDGIIGGVSGAAQDLASRAALEVQIAQGLLRIPAGGVPYGMSTNAGDVIYTPTGTVTIPRDSAAYNLVPYRVISDVNAEISRDKVALDNVAKAVTSIPQQAQDDLKALVLVGLVLLVLFVVSE